jgi:hypothetical protein
MLACVATGAPLQPGESEAWKPDMSDERQFAWILAGGLGPLLRWVAGQQQALMPAHWSAPLLAADLTARVVHGSLIDTALDVIAVCDELGVPATLLKGISVSDQLYPQAHLRPMADIDVLISSAVYPQVEARLLERGYLRLPYPDRPGFHHGAPLRHAVRRTVVELHTALFPDTSPLHGHEIFSPANLDRQTRESEFHGRAVRRLSDELQLVYIAAAWFDDMTTGRFQPSFLASLFDAVFLLKARSRTLDWTAMLKRLDSDLVKASLHTMLTYVTRFGVEPAPAAVELALARNGGYAGPIQRRSIHAALDRYLIGARFWSIPLPPPMPGRYSLRLQLRKLLPRSAPRKRSG